MCHSFIILTWLSLLLLLLLIGQLLLLLQYSALVLLLSKLCLHQESLLLLRCNAGRRIGRRHDPGRSDCCLLLWLTLELLLLKDNWDVDRQVGYWNLEEEETNEIEPLLIVDQNHACCGSNLREPNHGHNLLDTQVLGLHIKDRAVLDRVAGRGVDMDKGQIVSLRQFLKF